MSDIFDELGAQAAATPETSPFTGIFAPELIERLSPAELAAAFSGLARTLEKAIHTDVLIAGLPSEVIAAAQSHEQEGEAPEVAELRGRLMGAAAIRGEFTERRAALARDPVGAKMQALLDTQRTRGYIPRAATSSHRRGGKDAPKERAPIFEPTITANADERRARLEAMMGDEALHRAGGAKVLCHPENGSAVLFDLWPGHQWSSSINDEGMTIKGTPLRQLEPQQSFLETAERTIAKQLAGSGLKPRLVVGNSGLRLTAHNVLDDEDAPLINLSLVRFLQSNDSQEGENYQLATLNEDGRSYTWYPTAAGQAFGNQPVSDNGSLYDWAVAAFGQVPDVLRIGSTDPSMNVESRVIFAYQTGKPDTLFTDDGSQISGLRMRMLGFANNLSKYQSEVNEVAVVGGEFKPSTDEDSLKVRQLLAFMRPNFDVEVLAGDSADFFAAHPLRALLDMHASTDFGLLFALDEVGTDSSEDNNLASMQADIEERKVLALRAPQALGITTRIPDSLIRNVAEALDQTAARGMAEGLVRQVVGQLVAGAAPQLRRP